MDRSAAEEGDASRERKMDPPASSLAMAAEGEAGTITPSQEHFEKQAKVTKLSILFSLFMVVFLAAFDTTVVSTALPTIGHELKASDSQYTWIGSAYILASAAVTPSWGKVSDIFGRKPILLLASGVLFGGSLICALSINIPMLIGGRVIQGIGGGGLLTLSNICIADLIVLRKRGLYYGLIGIAVGTASALGPVIGGLLTQHVTWRWCFYINLPCDGVAFIVLLVFLKLETPHVSFMQGMREIDWTGTVLIIGGVVMFLFGLEAGGVTLPWSSATVISLIVVGVLLMIAFLIWQWKFAKHPTMPFRLFRNRSIVAAQGTTFCHSVVFVASNFYLPFYFQGVLGFRPVNSALAQLPYVSAVGITAMMASIYMRKTSRYRIPIWAGMALMTVGFGILTVMPATLNWSRVAPFEILAGLGAGPIFQAPIIAVQSHVHNNDIATGTASLGFVRLLAAAMGVVVGGVIFQNKINAAQGALRSLTDPKTTDAILSGVYGSSLGIIPNLPKATQEVVSGIYAAGLSSTWIFFTVVSGVGFLVSLLIVEKVPGRAPKEPKAESDLEMSPRLEATQEARQRTEE